MINKKNIVLLVISVFLSLVVVNNFFFEVEVIGTYTPVDYENNGTEHRHL
jgi:hypothetical protein